ncbi:MAG: hypothetical protein OXU36_01035 [Candidatus Poribacteria bacterium]|nr:hypothetical protein [Candidatus Poribacteria bacterium]
MAQSIIELSEQRGLEQGIEQGIEQGTRETTIQNIVSVLTARFPENAEHSVAEGLRAIQSIDRLQLLLRIAAQAPSFETFLERLDT